MKLAVLAIAVLTTGASAQVPRFQAPNVRIGEPFLPAEARAFHMEDELYSPGASVTWSTGVPLASPELTVSRLTVGDMHGLVATCELSGDSRAHDCRIAEGHTLDEVMQVWQDSSRQFSDQWGAMVESERQGCIDSLRRISDILNGKRKRP